MRGIGADRHDTAALAFLHVRRDGAAVLVVSADLDEVLSFDEMQAWRGQITEAARDEARSVKIDAVTGPFGTIDSRTLPRKSR